LRLGDALGAPFEGYWGHLLPEPEALLANYAEFEGYPRGQYTDDTQLTIATVDSVVRRGTPDPRDIARSIASLWKTQAVIGPGGACSFAANAFLRTGDWTTCGAPVGQAGNGTAMRTAALGLYFIADPDALPGAVAEVSRITHQDPRSVAGGVAIAKAAQLLATSDALDVESFCDDIAAATKPYEPSFAALIREIPARLREDREMALNAIAWAGSASPEFERPIITPFVVPTVLASLWAVFRHPWSWPHAVAEAIGLGGDVDTLGAIVGALAGARLGLSAIPAHLAAGVVGAARIKKLANRYFDTVPASATGRFDAHNRS
jgi:ADP-ribosyl-[dinitrogen reductase] hydrolase